MRGGIRFERVPGVARLADPREGFELRAFPVELRRDPLTGRAVRLGHFGAVRPVPLDPDAYRRPEVRGHCPFCPEHRGRELPRFPLDIAPEGWLEAGEAVLVPNLFPYVAHGAVCVLTRDHVVPLQGLTPGRLAAGLGLGAEYWRRVGRAEPAYRYPVMGWNYMPPSGGGLVHPHLQFFRFQVPPSALAEALAVSRARPGAWVELAQAERDVGERYLGRTGSWEWFVPFAPVGLWGEVWALAPEIPTLGALLERGWDDLLAGLTNLLGRFAALGIHSFNAALFVGPEEAEPLPAQVRVVPRTFLNDRDHAPDLNFFQAVLSEPVCAVWPERLAADLRSGWG